MNKEEFSYFYHQYLEKIYRFVYLRINSPENAQDLTAQVFLKFWDSAQKKNLINPSAFLYRLARNQVIDFYRQKERQNISLENLPPTLAEFSLTDSSLEKINIALEIEMIKKVLQTINPSYTEIIIWHYLDDLSIKEISEILKKKEVTIRVLLHRALKALKEEINLLDNSKDARYP